MNGIAATRGGVFNIQHYSIHDGPGIRTTVFLKGCPLRCLWCQNPESQVSQAELFFDSAKCKACGTCAPVCPTSAIEIRDGRLWTNRQLCRGSGRCAAVCPNEARHLMGREMTAGEVFKEVNGDAIFYQQSGGGVTLSGGDPVSQPKFSTDLLRLCKEAGLHTAIDTCGHIEWETLRTMLEWVDLVLLDLKHMDSSKHKELTGVANDWILENARRICHELSVPLWVRVPIIPGYNDSIENIASTAGFVARQLGPSVRMNLLPYHTMGETKYERLEVQGRSFLAEPPSDQAMVELQQLIESFRLSVSIGG